MELALLHVLQNGNTLPAMKTLTVKVSDALFEEIASAAQTRKLSRSEIVRERLEKTLGSAGADNTSLWSRMEDLVIRTDTLPVDLSSDKAHLTGYGKDRHH